MRDPLRMRISLGYGTFWVCDAEERPGLGRDDLLEPDDPAEPSVTIDVEFPPGSEDQARALLARVFVEAHEAVDAFQRAPSEDQHAAIRKERRRYGMAPLPWQTVEQYEAEAARRSDD